MLATKPQDAFLPLCFVRSRAEFFSRLHQSEETHAPPRLTATPGVLFPACWASSAPGPPMRALRCMGTGQTGIGQPLHCRTQGPSRGAALPLVTLVSSGLHWATTEVGGGQGWGSLFSSSLMDTLNQAQLCYTREFMPFLGNGKQLSISKYRTDSLMANWIFMLVI